MSETEINKGTLTKLDLQGDIEEKCKQAVELLGLAYNPDNHDSYQECIEDAGYRSAYIYQDDIYQVTYSPVEDDGDIYEANKNEDGTIDFLTRFYNGGCSFNEALDYAMEKLSS